MANQFDAKVAVGQALAHLRNEKGLSQTEVAKRMGTSPVVVSRWENGKNTPEPKKLYALASLYDTTPDQFWPEPKQAARLAKDALKKRR